MKTENHLRNLTSISSDHGPHISAFIPLDGHEKIHMKNLRLDIQYMLEREGQEQITFPSLDWASWNQTGSKTLALYLTREGFIPIPLPFRMERKFIISDTFYAKPLVALKSFKESTLLLHFNQKTVSLYKVNQAGEFFVDSFLPKRIFSKRDWPEQISGRELKTFIDDLKVKVERYLDKPDIKALVITGLDHPYLDVNHFWEFTEKESYLVPHDYYNLTPEISFSYARSKLGERINKSFERQVNQILEDSLFTKASEDYTKIAQLIQGGKIKKILIALEDNQFGVLCKESGKLSLNEKQESTKDHCILDNLLSLCLVKKVKVKVIPRKFFPRGKSLLAA